MNICKNTVFSAFAFFSLTSFADIASATTLATTNGALVTAFQTGATVLGFDELTPNSVGGSLQGNTGAAIQAASQLSAQYAAQGITFSSTGGPVGVVSVQGLSNQADARSPFNVIGGSSLSGGIPVLDYFQTITVTFDPTMLATKIGAWNDPTGSRITLSAFDSNGTVIDTITGDQGLFLGITGVGIAKATFAYVTTQGAEGFSLDDVTFAAAAAPSATPLPATSLLFVGGLGLLAAVRSQSSRKKRSAA